jgi:hypothetical protein
MGITIQNRKKFPIHIPYKLGITIQSRKKFPVHLISGEEFN